MKTLTAEIGTISHGTLRTQDLLEAFAAELRRLNPKGDLAYITDRFNEPGYFESEDAQWDLETLSDTLNAMAPEGCYFGAHPGDGADFGFWPHEESEIEPAEPTNDLTQHTKRSRNMNYKVTITRFDRQGNVATVHNTYVSHESVVAGTWIKHAFKRAGLSKVFADIENYGEPTGFGPADKGGFHGSWFSWDFAKPGLPLYRIRCGESIETPENL